MANYVTESELNTYLWTSGETALLDELNNLATAYINNYLKVTDLNEQTDKEEIQDYTWKTEYFTKELNPSNLTLVNWSAVVWEINITWRKISFQFAPLNTDTVFNKISFTYNYWYATIPDDIKWVVYNIVSFLYNWRKTTWLKSFTQWQISVSYEDTQKINDLLFLWLTKYIKNTIYC